MAQKYPTSLTEERQNPERLAKLVLQKTLNQMNLTMELSDWQMSGAALGLPSTICSDVFVHGKTSGDIGYRKHIMDAEDSHAARSKLIDEVNLPASRHPTYYGNNGGTYDAAEVDGGVFEWEQMEGEPGDSVSIDDSSCSRDSIDAERMEEEAEDNQWDDEDDDEAEEDTGIDNGDEEQQTTTYYNEAVATTTRTVDLSESAAGAKATLATEDLLAGDSDAGDAGKNMDAHSSKEEPSPVDHFIGNISVHRVPCESSSDGTDRESLVIPDAELYNNRGEALRFLNRHEYYSLIRIEDVKPPTSSKRKPRMARYPFHSSFDLYGKKEQVVVAKQPTMILHDPWPRHPPDPEDPGDMSDPESDWSKAANRFASYVLTEYRPETHNFGNSEGTVQYNYNYEALIDWVEQCMDSACMLDKFRLSSVSRRSTALNSSPFAVKQMAMAYRGRNRTLWTVEETQEYCRSQYLRKLQRDEDENLMDQWEFEEKHRSLSKQANDNMELQEGYDKKICHSFFVASRTEHQDTDAPPAAAAISSNDGSNQQQKQQQQQEEDQQRSKGMALEQPRSHNRYYPEAAKEAAKIEGRGLGEQEELVRLRLKQSDLSRKLDQRLDCVLDDEGGAETMDRPLSHQVQGGRTTPSAKEAAVQKARHGLNAKQLEVFDLYHNYFEQGFQSDLVPSVFLVHGMGGAGKTEGITRLQPLAKFYGAKILPTSFNCINALMFPDGKTTASIIKVAAKDDFINLTLERKKELEKLLENVKLIIIDEVGNQAPYHLAQLSHICQIVLQNSDEPFGGLPVVLIGDYGQMGPVKAGEPIPKAVMTLSLREREQAATKKPSSARKQKSASSGKRRRKTSSLLRPTVSDKQCHPNHPYTVGARLLRDAQFLEMTEQMRSQDAEHTELITNMYQGREVKLEPIFKLYKPLRPSDFEKDAAGWTEAPIVVQSNRERLSLTHDKAVAYAKLNNTVVIRWLAKHKNWAQKPDASHQEQAMLNDPCFFEYFVPGARCYFNANVCKKLKLVNGMVTRHHSLVMPDEESNEWLRNEIDQASPGDVITLPFLQKTAMIPAVVTVTMEVPPENTELLERYSSLFETVCAHDQNSGVDEPRKTVKFLVPVAPQVGRSFIKCTVRSGNGYRPSRIKVRPQFPLELAFAITVHKSQGQTLDKVILALSRRPSPAMMQITYNALYVALSRVRTSSNIRILFVGETVQEEMAGLLYLLDLKPDPYQISFIHGFRNGLQVDDRCANLGVGGRGSGTQETAAAAAATRTQSARRRWNADAAYWMLHRLDSR